MRAMVVYETSFGNTGLIAEAVWRGVAEQIPGAQLHRVDAAPTTLPSTVELLVVGGPKQAFGMGRPSRPSTHNPDHARVPITTTTVLREWLHRLEVPEGQVSAATFDTRIHLPLGTGTGALGAVNLLRRSGFEVTGEAESFFVDGIKGPLREGELERAHAWGRSLTALLLDVARR